jgi:hypothetical protein
MRVKRDQVRIKRMSKEDDSFAQASPEELISFMWELTAEIWSLRGEDYVKRRLQRDVTNLIRK